MTQKEGISSKTDHFTIKAESGEFDDGGGGEKQFGFASPNPLLPTIPYPLTSQQPLLFSCQLAIELLACHPYHSCAGNSSHAFWKMISELERRVFLHSYFFCVCGLSVPFQAAHVIA